MIPSQINNANQTPTLFGFPNPQNGFPNSNSPNLNGIPLAPPIQIIRQATHPIRLPTNPKPVREQNKIVIQKNANTEDVAELYTLLQKLIGHCQIELYFNEIEPGKEMILKSSQRLQQLNQSINTHREAFKFSPQIENAVEPELKFLILHWKLVTAQQHYFTSGVFSRLMNPKEFSYKFTQSNTPNPEEEEQFDGFIQELQESKLLVYQCKSEQHARAINKILNQQINIAKLQKLLETQRIQIDETGNLQINQFPFNSKVRQKAESVMNSSLIVFSIIQSNQQDLNILQQNFTSFIDSPNNIKCHIEKGQLKSVNQCNKNELDNFIYQQSLNGFEILLTDQTYDVQFRVYKIEWQFQFWFDSATFERQKREIVQQLKTNLEEIVDPDYHFTLDKEQQIHIWRHYLEAIYEKKKLQLKSQMRGRAMELNIKGEKNFCYKIKDDIQEELSKLQILSIPMNVKHQRESVRLLQNKNFELLFKDKITIIIQENKAIKLLQLEDIDFKIGLITFLAVIEKDAHSQSDLQKLIDGHIISQLQLQEIKFDSLEFFKFYQISNYEELESKYSVSVQDNNDGKICIVSTQNNVNQLVQCIKQLQETTLKQYKSVKIPVSNPMVSNELNQIIISGQFVLPKEISFVILKGAIQLNGPEQLVKQTEEQIKEQVKTKQKSLHSKTCIFDSKELKLIKKQCEDLISSYRAKGCQVEYDMSTKVLSTYEIEQYERLKITFEKKELIIAQVDQLRIDCDAIVNSSNTIMNFDTKLSMSERFDELLELTGKDFLKFSKAYIKKHKSLDYGQVAVYDPQQGSVKHIFSVATPIYSSGAQTVKDLELIQGNISEIFKQANQRKLASICLPVFGGETGYNYAQCAKLVINKVIDCLFDQNSTLTKVYVFETDSECMQLLVDACAQLLQPQQDVQSAKFQWQWEENSVWKNYDDEDINLQIDQAYKKYQNDSTCSECRLHFPLTKIPGTHKIDLKAATCTDIQLSKVSKIELKAVEGGKKCYFINDVKQDTKLNEYFTYQLGLGNQSFTIFNKKHKIVFSNDSIVQINEETGFKRNVRPTDSILMINSQLTNTLIGKPYQLSYKYSTPSQNSLIISHSIKMESFNKNLIQKLHNELRAFLDSQIVELKLQIPQMSPDEFDELQAYIKQASFRRVTDLAMGTDVVLQILKSKQTKIQQIIDQMLQNARKFPVEWTYQEGNFSKVRLDQACDEYQRVEAQFKKNCPKSIYAIYRIQNKVLYQNFIYEKQKLVKAGKSHNIEYLPEELEMFVWHGVRGGHPKVIYEGLKEAFDISFSSQTSYWGPGIYFAEKSIYSVAYSYTLQQKDDPEFVGKKVFLLCKICTGKIHDCKEQRKNDLRRPPQDFDCVQGFTDGSIVYILYGMDARRAYPAYEVIYEP